MLIDCLYWLLLSQLNIFLGILLMSFWSLSMSAWVNELKSYPFLYHLLMIPLICSFDPLCHEAYGSQKYTFASIQWASNPIFSNSSPLSQVIVLTLSLYFLINLYITELHFIAFLLLRRLIYNSLVLRSTSVRIFQYPVAFFPIIKSTSQCPYSSRLSIY